MDYDQEYGRTEALFGVEPDGVLIDHWRLLDRGLPVLDVGCGQGRHALWLARHGLDVWALDPSQVACDTVTAAARKERLPVRVVRGGFEDPSLPAGSFGGVLVMGLIPDLERTAIARLVARVGELTAVGGLVLVSAHTSDDPRYPEISAAWQEIGVQSFRRPGGGVRTYLAAGELARLLAAPRFELVHSWEGLGPVHRHGDGAPERHARAVLVARRTA